MSWTLAVPHRSRADGLADIAAAEGALADREDRLVLRELIIEAAGNGVKTAGDLIDRLERTDPAARRALLDEMRTRAGLETTADIEAHRRYEAANHPAVLSAKRRQRATLEMGAGGGFVEVNEDAIESERKAQQLKAERKAARPIQGRDVRGIREGP